MIRITAMLALLLGGAIARADLAPEEPPGALLRRRDKPPAPPASCAVELRLRSSPSASGVLLEATLRNRTRKRLRFAIANHCPAEPITLTGLPANLDPFHTCNRGACIESHPIVVDLSPGASRRIARAQLTFAGDACSAPLPHDRYHVAFTVEPVGPAPLLCAAAPVVVSRPPRAATPPLAPPQKPSRCPNLPCGIGCPNGMGMAHDENGCTLCACAKSPLEELRRP